MPKFTVEAETELTPQESFAKLKNLLDRDHDLRKFDAKYTCQFDDGKLSGEAKGSQFKALLQVTPKGQGSSVAITVDLPFALGLFKSKIQQILQHKMNSTLA